MADGRPTDYQDGMPDVSSYLSATDAPAEQPYEFLDARNLPPPQPLQRTLEALVELDEGTVFVQLNDRAPQHLYPQLEDRGYRYETLETEDGMVTVIWRD